jgi:hypothetical protein
MDWANSWKDVVEMDIFDHSTIKDVLAKLASASNEAEARFNLHRLMVTTWSREVIWPFSSKTFSHHLIQRRD